MHIRKGMKREATYGDVFAELHRRVAASPSKKQAAADLGISPQYLNDLIKGQRPITDQLAAAMGFPKSPATYRRAG